MMGRKRRFGASLFVDEDLPYVEAIMKCSVLSGIPLEPEQLVRFI